MKVGIFMKKLFAAIFNIIAVTITVPSFAQGQISNDGRARHHNFYHKIELTSGNLYSFAASSCLTGLINYLVDDAFLETGLEIPVYREHVNNAYIFSRQNMFGLESRDVLHNLGGSIKLGYQTYDPRFVNFGICGIAQYKYEPFFGSGSADGETICYPADISRILLGGNLMLMLGEMGMDTQVTIEAGLKYSMGLKYNDAYSILTPLPLNDGLTSHYAVSFGGPGYFQNIKFFADISHFKLIEAEHISLSPIYIGLSWIVTPQQSYNKR